MTRRNPPVRNLEAEGVRAEATRARGDRSVGGRERFRVKEQHLGARAPTDGGANPVGRMWQISVT